MEGVASKAKTTAQRIASVPQKIGHSILTAPKIFKRRENNSNNSAHQQQTMDDEREQRDVPSDDETNDSRNNLHERVCSNLVDDLHGRIAVKESQQECMREITEHLKLHIFTITGSSPTCVDRYEYEDWIEALHPDNVNYLNSGRYIIDHRFYMKDSHHRQLWNEYMIKLGCEDSLVMEESRDKDNDFASQQYNSENWPDECCVAVTNSCGLFP